MNRERQKTSAKTCEKALWEEVNAPPTTWVAETNKADGTTINAIELPTVPFTRKSESAENNKEQSANLRSMVFPLTQPNTKTLSKTFRFTRKKDKKNRSEEPTGQKPLNWSQQAAA